MKFFYVFSGIGKLKFSTTPFCIFILAAESQLVAEMGPKRGGRQARGARHEPRRDQKKTWEDGADNLEASLSRLKVDNDDASSSEVDEEGSCSTGESSSEEEKVETALSDSTQLQA